MFVEENSASIYLQGKRDKSVRSGTKFAREIQLTDWSTAGNLSNRSSRVQIPRNICTRFRRYLYSRRCSWIINKMITLSTACLFIVILVHMLNCISESARETLRRLERVLRKIENCNTYAVYKFLTYRRFGNAAFFRVQD